MRASRESVGRGVGGSGPVADLVAHPKQFSECLLLPGCGQVLIVKVNQAALVSSDEELGVVKIGSPLLHGHQDCHAFLLIGGEATFAWVERFAHVSNGLPSCCRTVPTPWAHASMSMTNCLVKSGSCSNGAEMSFSFSVERLLCAACPNEQLVLLE